MDGRKRIKNIWYGMRRRCHHPAPSDYSNGIEAYYHGRGIKVCEEWLNDFDCFYKWAIENGYQDNLTIDRIDPDGNYEPSNCRWITRSENCGLARRHATYSFGYEKSSAKARKVGRYFTVKRILWMDFCIVDAVKLSYHDAIERQSELKLPPGTILCIMKHEKETRTIEPGDIVSIQNPGVRKQ